MTGPVPLSGTPALVAAAVADEGLRLRRAWPRSSDHLLLDLAGPSGPVAGQWFADPERAARVAERTGDPARAVPGSGVVLQPRGADRRLPALAGLLAEPGAVLVGHRPERRAVVRAGDAATYTKVVRPERAAATAEAARVAGSLGVTAPRVTAWDAASGTVTTEALPGRPLYDVLGDPRATADEAASAGRALGAALAALATREPPQGAPRHDGAAELAVTRRWVELATGQGAVPPGVAAALEAGLGELAGLLPPVSRWTPLHRDLHDKQVLVRSGGAERDDAVGLLDFDLVAAGDPALDLANLLVHLDLRARQGRTTATLAAACADGVLDTLRPDAPVREALLAYALATRLRLVAVYAYRPDSAAAALTLLDPPAAD